MFIQFTMKRWIQIKALLSFLLATSLTVGLVTIPLWASAATTHAYQTGHKKEFNLCQGSRQAYAPSMIQGALFPVSFDNYRHKT